jgi:hypothetical protein
MTTTDDTTTNAGELTEISRVGAWLIKKVVRRTDALVRFASVSHVSISGKLSEIERWPIECPLTDADALTLGAEVERAATEDAESLSAPGKYIVKLLGGSDAKRELGRLPLRIDPESSEDNEAMSEPPTSKGLTAQAMRHVEGVMRLSVGSSASTIQTLQRALARSHETIEKMMAERLENMHAIEMAESRRHERDLELVQSRNKAKFQEETFRQLAILGPVVVNKLVGKQILPEVMDPKMMQLKALLGSLTEEQLSGLGQVLAPTQVISFLQFYESFREQELTKTNGAS